MKKAFEIYSTYALLEALDLLPDCCRARVTLIVNKEPEPLISVFDPAPIYQIILVKVTLVNRIRDAGHDFDFDSRPSHDLNQFSFVAGVGLLSNDYSCCN